MKQSLGFLAMIALFFILSISGKPDNKKQIYGVWSLLIGKHNGKVAPQFLSDRIQSFNMDNTFKSQIKTDKGLVVSNCGLFYLINDTTIVTYHQDLLGKMSTIANTYNFKIKNDTMHFFGFYLSQSQQNASFLTKVYIDEWWVKENKK